MRADQFQFKLPEELIARYPAAERSASRLLGVDRQNGQLADYRFSQIPDLLNAGDLLVFNDTRVIPARLFGVKDTGGAVEVLVERVLDQQRVLAHVRASKSPKPGRVLILEHVLRARVVGRQGELFELCFDEDGSVLEQLERVGRIPLPPYIEREADEIDRQRYQTVYARSPGAVAAPTAGLHFDQALIEALIAKGVEVDFVTLHVGAGTFQPVRVENIHDHHMHSERIEVSASVCEKIAQTRARGGRVVAVGTTVVRSLESAAKIHQGVLKPYSGDTDIFIYPGYQFVAVDALITNFHLPESTLLMLVSAFAGRENTLAAYAHAIAEKYRFYSYGDAMFLR